MLKAGIALTFYVVTFLSSLSLSANSADFPERKIPDVKTTTIQGTEYKCFDIPQYTSLLLLSSDYQALRHIYYLNVPKTYEDIEKVYELKLQLKDDEIGFLNTRIKEYQTTEDKNRRRLQLSLTGWKIVAGVEAVLLVAVTGYAIFK